MASHVVVGSPRHRRPPSRGRLCAVALVAVLLVAASWVALRPGPDVPPSPVAVQVLDTSRPVRAMRAGRAAVEVLRAWDEARAAAYASGSVASLRELYAAGAGASDVRLLRSYLRRGYRVTGMRMQLLAVRVLADEPDAWLLRVTDRLAGGEAVGHGERLPLPRDRASTRTVRLEHGEDGRWRVVSVRS